MVPHLALGEIVLPRQPAHYVRDVLRAREGDTLCLFDGKGREASATVAAIDARSVVLSVAAPRLRHEVQCPVTVGLAHPKGERADWAVEKLTEVGVQRVVWLLCSRSVVTPRAGGKRQARWQRLAEAAAAQAGRTTVPEIEGPMPLAEFAMVAAEVRLFADRSGHRLASILGRQRFASVAVAIGPEGGFAPEELVWARENGYTLASLGPHIMRVETAAVVAAAMATGMDPGWSKAAERD